MVRVRFPCKHPSYPHYDRYIFRDLGQWHSTPRKAIELQQQSLVGRSVHWRQLRPRGLAVPLLTPRGIPVESPDPLPLKASNPWPALRAMQCQGSLSAAAQRLWRPMTSYS